jgi:hypothetical protein
MERVIRDLPENASIEDAMEKVSTLEVFPAAGRIVPESKWEHAREILHGNYRIVYR